MEAFPRERNPGPEMPASSVKPKQERARNWWPILKRTALTFRETNRTDDAAALTYFSVLALFPGLIALLSILGLAGPSATEPLIDSINQLAPGPARDLLAESIAQISAAPAAGLGLVIGLFGALWAASGYIGAFSRASNEIYDMDEGRPFWKLRPLQLAMTALIVLVLAAAAIAVVLTGPVAEEIGDLIGMGETAVQVWEIVKWPVIALTVLAVISFLYYGAPNVRMRGWRLVTPGALVAAGLWILASLGFAFYVANFSSYNATYGSLAGVIVFLVWLWISNVAILFGAQLDAERERERELNLGVPERETLTLPPREPASE